MSTNWEITKRKSIFDTNVSNDISWYFCIIVISQTMKNCLHKARYKGRNTKEKILNIVKQIVKEKKSFISQTKIQTILLHIKRKINK